MIPKIIHYCWFGGNPLPESEKKCIASWRKFLPDYEIWQWSEGELVSSDANHNDNDDDDELRALEARRGARASTNVDVNHLFDKLMPFDVNSIPYTQQAYEAKKYAFVSDYARFRILYKYGGLYFDTDVEIIKPLDDIIERGPFMGIELIDKDCFPKVNPGLGLGMSDGNIVLKSLLEKYSNLQFIGESGELNLKTIVDYTSEVLRDYGLEPNKSIQEVAGVWIYPTDYFNPLDSLTGRLKLTDNTRSIHWYMNSWSDSSALRQWLSRMSHRLFGMKLHHLKSKL